MLKLILMMKDWDISCEVACKLMSLDLFDQKLKHWLR